jgi:hypothetical protein
MPKRTFIGLKHIIIFFHFRVKIHIKIQNPISFYSHVSHQTNRKKRKIKTQRYNQINKKVQEKGKVHAEGAEEMGILGGVMQKASILIFLARSQIKDERCVQTLEDSLRKWASWTVGRWELTLLKEEELSVEIVLLRLGLEESSSNPLRGK